MAEIRWINKNKSCIEIFLVPILQTDQRLINKNKSCIEILKYHTSLFAPLRLIKTRVVLKFHSAFCTSINYWINKNKSCIEIAFAAGTGRVYED